MLIDVLIAVALLGLGVAGLMRLHGTLRAGSDAARQRAEALRLAEADLELLRAFTRLNASAGSGPAWSSIAAQAPTELTDFSSSTIFTRERAVADAGGTVLKTVTTTLRWADRTALDQALSLPTMIAGLDPALVGALLLRRSDSQAAGVWNRHPLIPLRARTLADGRVAYKPREPGTLTWVFDATTARVTARCSSRAGLSNADLTIADLGDCTALSGMLLSGVVRFATGSDSLGSTEAENPNSPAMDLDLRITLSSTGHPDPAWECEDDAPSGVPPAATTLTTVHYTCVVQPAGNPPRWSGRLDIVPGGWSLAASGAGAFRVCRYSADHDGNGRIDNREHPQRYSNVTEPLGDQNFLVVRAAAACPSDAAANLADLANWVDDSTVAHQP